MSTNLDLRQMMPKWIQPEGDRTGIFFLNSLTLQKHELITQKKGSRTCKCSSFQILQTFK